MDTAPQTAVVWMVGGAEVNTSPDRISATGDTLSFSPLATSDTGSYTCELTVTAQQTHVTVQPPEQSAVEDITVQSNVLCCMVIHSLLYYITIQSIVHISVLNFHVMSCPSPTQSPSLVSLSLQTALLPCMLALASLSPVL